MRITAEYTTQLRKLRCKRDIDVADAVIKYWNESTEAYDLDVSPAIANVSGSPLTVKFQASHPNYVTATFGEATVTINPAEVTITVDNASKVFGKSTRLYRHRS